MFLCCLKLVDVAELVIKKATRVESPLPCFSKRLNFYNLRNCTSGAVLDSWLLSGSGDAAVFRGFTNHISALTPGTWTCEEPSAQNGSSSSTIDVLADKASNRTQCQIVQDFVISSSFYVLKVVTFT